MSKFVFPERDNAWWSDTKADARVLLLAIRKRNSFKSRVPSRWQYLSPDEEHTPFRALFIGPSPCWLYRSVTFRWGQLFSLVSMSKGRARARNRKRPAKQLELQPTDHWQVALDPRRSLREWPDGAAGKPLIRSPPHEFSRAPTSRGSHRQKSVLEDLDGDTFRRIPHPPMCAMDSAPALRSSRCVRQVQQKGSQVRAGKKG